jgi:hypothetical protein
LQFKFVVVDDGVIVVVKKCHLFLGHFQMGKKTFCFFTTSISTFWSAAKIATRSNPLQDLKLPAPKFTVEQ